MAQASRTFRIFVSSTFEDLEAERNALHEHVYPELREFCAQRNARFQPIDLRWGVSEEASLDQQAMAICLGEIRRCHEVTPRPNFLVLLGNRYGWLPPPPQIPADEFAQIVARVSDPKEGGLLEAWYRRDDNADPPAYFLIPREKGGPYEEYEQWKPLESRLHSILVKAVAGTAPGGDPKYVASATEQEIRAGALSERAAEDQAFCLFREITGDHPNPTAANEGDPILKYLDPDQGPLDALKETLRAQLPDQAIKEYKAGWDGQRPTSSHLEQLVEDAKELLKTAIEHELDDPLPLRPTPGAPPRFGADEHLDAEGREHRKFAEERSRIFEGREGMLEAIAGYLDGDDPRPFVVHGKGGTGKSALLAEALARAQGPDGELVYRFIGATPDSSSGRELLRSLCAELARRYEPDSEVPDDYQKLVTDFRERLERAGAARPLHLFLDSLDQLSPADGARSLSWLPSPVPAGVRLVVSTRPGDTLQPLERRGARLEELGALSHDDGTKVLQRWLDEADRDLQPAQRDAVLDRFDRSEGNPLWLRLAFEEARRWRSDEEPEELATGIAPEDGSRDGAGKREITGIIAKNTFPRLADEDNHGQVLVSRALGYVAASRYGLAEDELLALLASDLEVYRWFVRGAFHLPPDVRQAASRYRGQEDGGSEWFAALRADETRQEELDEFLAEILPRGEVSLPVVLWSRLFADLRPYLSERSAEGGTLIGFYHRELDEVSRLLYLPGEEAQACHLRLADYFRCQADPAGDGSWAGASVRGLSEVPYHLAQGADGNDARWQELHDTLTNFRFLERKAAEVGAVKTGSGEEATTTYTGVFQLQDDFALALERMPGGGDGARGGRRRIIVTITDFGEGYVVRCPHCNVVHTFDRECTACQEVHDLADWRGREKDCPNEACRGPLKVNEFVVPPRR